MIIYTTDDNPAHNGIIQGMVRKWCTSNTISHQIIPCQNGQELLQKMAGRPANLITLDINMPILDGLSALVIIRSKYKLTPIIMVSSESESNIARHTTADEKANNINNSQRKLLLQRVIERVIAGQTEPGKINSVLEAVSTLKMNPVDVALTHGANEFVQKPYQIQDVELALTKLKCRFKMVS